MAVGLQSLASVAITQRYCCVCGKASSRTGKDPGGMTIACVRRGSKSCGAPDGAHALHVHLTCPRAYGDWHGTRPASHTMTDDI